MTDSKTIAAAAKEILDEINQLLAEDGTSFCEGTRDLIAEILQRHFGAITTPDDSNDSDNKAPNSLTGRTAEDTRDGGSTPPSVPTKSTQSGHTVPESGTSVPKNKKVAPDAITPDQKKGDRGMGVTKDADFPVQENCTNQENEREGVDVEAIVHFLVAANENLFSWRRPEMRAKLLPKYINQLRALAAEIKELKERIRELGG